MVSGAKTKEAFMSINYTRDDLMRKSDNHLAYLFHQTSRLVAVRTRDLEQAQALLLMLTQERSRRAHAPNPAP
jgi:hypothetical protein